MDDERRDEPQADAPAAEQEDGDTDDTEGQALTWKVRKPIPKADEDDVEGHSVRPPPDLAVPGLPGLEEDDDVEGHGETTNSPRPVD